MKGMVFTELIEMIEARFSLELAESIIEACALPSGGAYTAIGTYDHAELVAIVVELAKRTGAEIPQLIHAFGGHLFATFLKDRPALFAQMGGTFALLEHLDGTVHVEVRKLYPDAELPRFHAERRSPTHLALTYTSERGFADLAHGLIDASIAHYREPITVTSEDLSAGRRAHVRFDLHHA
jgi:hypothetical protein